VKAHLRRVKGGLCLAALCALGYTLAELLAPWPLKIIFDHVLLEKPLPPSLAILNGALQSGKSSAIVTISFGILLIAAFKAAFAYTQLYLTSRIGHQMVYTLRRELFAHLQRLSLSFYNRARSGELLTKVTSDTNMLKDVFSESALSFVSQLLTLVGMFAVLFLLNWRLSLIVTATFPVLSYTIFSIYRRTKASARKQREREGRLASQINEALGSTLLVRAFAREGYEQRRFDGESSQNLTENIRTARMEAGAARTVEIINAAGVWAAALFGALQVVKGQMTPGDVLIFTAYLINMVSSELHQRWQELRQQLHWYYGKVSGAETRGKVRLLGADRRLREEILRCETALANVARQLQTQDPNFVWLQQSGGMNVEDLRGALAEDEAVIEYYFDAERLKIFVIDRRQMRVVSGERGLPEMSELIQRLRFQLNKFQYGPAYLAAHSARLLHDTNNCLHQLWQALYAPGADLAGAKKLIIIPFGALHNVPFQALFDGEKYLLERNEIAYSPSSKLLKLCAAAAVGKYERAVIFGAADETAPKITEEIRAIRALFPDGYCFTGAAATAQALTRHASSGEILHIASHAAFRHDNPMFSAFKLSGSWLNFFDIRALKLPASLVVLSGCSTGASRIYAGDEMMGLARGFLSAGAASLVVSLWTVNDPATAKLMTAFYRKLRGGMSIRAALRSAALEIKSQYEHPYYWAPPKPSTRAMARRSENISRGRISICSIWRRASRSKTSWLRSPETRTWPSHARTSASSPQKSASAARLKLTSEVRLTLTTNHPSISTASLRL